MLIKNVEIIANTSEVQLCLKPEQMVLIERDGVAGTVQAKNLKSGDIIVEHKDVKSDRKPAK